MLLYIRTYTAIPQLPRFPEGQNKSWLRLFFARYCPNVRVILDCTEIRCEAPSSLTLQSETFSHYKNTNTFKGLIGIAPCGVITLISKLYTGSISDREITQQSGILLVYFSQEMQAWLTKAFSSTRCSLKLGPPS